MEHWVRGVSVVASTKCWCWLAPAYQLKRMRKRRLPQGSSVAGCTEMILDWSSVVKGWSCMTGSALQSVQGSGLRRGYKSGNTALVI